MSKAKNKLRNLVVVLGDQLSHQLSALDGFDPARDLVWMAEAGQEASYGPSHKQRLVLFFSAMRHFKRELLAKGLSVSYRAMGEAPAAKRPATLWDLLEGSLRELRPQRVLLSQPGDYRVRQGLRRAAQKAGVELQIRPDRHFLCGPGRFQEWAQGRKSLVMEHFYRAMRRRYEVLLDADGWPVGGRWNLDTENRASFGKAGTPQVPVPLGFAPDNITREVMVLVGRRFADHPGSLEGFDLPVTGKQARLALKDFVEKRLPRFGRYQDAMWTDQPFLFHSRLSAPLNLHLLDPRDCLAAAQEAFGQGLAPLNSVEGFVRQVLGWREFVRGIYWLHMPAYQDLNHLEARRDLPWLFWSGETDLNCLAQLMAQVLARGYAHHIQRLMVAGLFCLLWGVRPLEFHRWHMALYLDAVDWASLPNTLGMSQYADGGLVGTKPYAASGAYIERMSNYCRDCRYQPRKAAGDEACPFTTLYWDFLDRHQALLAKNPRMVLQLRNLAAKKGKDSDLPTIRKRAQKLRQKM